jgi:hypothetical protein
MTHGYIEADNKVAMLKRLHHIEGQVRGIERIVDEERYCIDILTQIGAVSTALDSLASAVSSVFGRSLTVPGTLSPTWLPSSIRNLSPRTLYRPRTRVRRGTSA